MVSIVIEIKDSIPSSIYDKISAIDQVARATEKSILSLSTSLKNLGASELKDITGSLKSLTASQEKLTSAQAKELILLERLNREREKTAKQSAIHEEKIKQQILLTSSYTEKLEQQRIKTEKLTNSKERLNGVYGLLNTTLNAVSAGFRLLFGSIVLDKLFGTIDAFTLLDNRLKLVSSSSLNQAKLNAEIFRTANETRVPVEELGKSFIRFDYALKALGASQQESIRFTKTLSQQISLSGLSTAEQSSALLQLSQALNKGKLDGDEFRTVMETLPTLATAIAKTMKVARGELIKLAPEGKITSDIIREAVRSIADETEANFKKTNATIGQSFTVIGNNIVEFIGKINSFSGISNGFANTLLFVAQNIDVLGIALIGVSVALTVNYIPAVIKATTTTATFFATLASNPYVLVAGTLASLVAGVIYYRDTVITSTGANLSFGDSLKAIATEFPVINNLMAILPDSVRNFGSSLFEANGFMDRFIQNLKTPFKSAIGGVQVGLTNLILLGASLTDSYFITNDALGKISDSMQVVANQREKEISDAEKIQKSIEEQARKNRDLAETNKLLAESYKLLSKEKNKGTSQGNIDIKVREIEDDYNLRIARLENYLSKDEKLRSQHAQLLYDLEIDKINKIAQARNPEKYKEYLADMEREQNIINSVIRESQEYANTLKAVNSLREQGRITQEQGIDALNRTSLMQKKLALDEEIRIKAEKNNFDLRLIMLNEELDKKVKFVELNKQLYGGDEGAKKKIQEIYAFTANQESIIDKERENYHAERIKREEEIRAESDKTFQEGLKQIKKRQKEEALAILKKEDDNKKLFEKIRSYNQQSKSGFSDDPVSKTSFKINEEEERFRIAKEAFEREKGNTLYFQKEMELAEKNHQAKLNQIRLAGVGEGLGILSEGFDAFADLAKKREGESSKTAKILFGISKALALGQAIVETASAISKANAATGPYDKGPAIALAAAVGATQMATIIGSSLQGFATGGYVSGAGTTTSDSLIRVSNKEFVVNAQSTANNRDLLEDINTRGRTGSIANTYYQPSSKGNVIVNNYSNAKVETNYNDNGDLEVRILAMVDAKIASDLSQGPEASKTSKAIHGLNKRGY